MGILQAVILAGAAVLAAQTAAPAPRSGEIHFLPTERESVVPKQFQLADHRFPFEERLLETSSTTFTLSEVTFPSPVTTAVAINNTVPCEFFRAHRSNPGPGVVVLHILGGDFALSRAFSRTLASNGCSALFVKMPYYGPRRPPGSKLRMISFDPHETVSGMTQAVLDIRRATAWLGTQPEVDPKRLGILGVSLGGITGALAATAEPRLDRICLILAGGDIGQVAWESKVLTPLRERWVAGGGTRESLTELLKTVDPVTYGVNVRGRQVLMLNARHDEVIPPACTTSLWTAFGQPTIVWWDAGHVSAAQYMFQGLSRAVKFFNAPVAANAPR